MPMEERDLTFDVLWIWQEDWGLAKAWQPRIVIQSAVERAIAGKRREYPIALR